MLSLRPGRRGANRALAVLPSVKPPALQHPQESRAVQRLTAATAQTLPCCGQGLRRGRSRRSRHLLGSVLWVGMLMGLGVLMGSVTGSAVWLLVRGRGGSLMTALESHRLLMLKPVEPRGENVPLGLLQEKPLMGVSSVPWREVLMGREVALLILMGHGLVDIVVVGEGAGVFGSGEGVLHPEALHLLLKRSQVAVVALQPGSLLVLPPHGPPVVVVVCIVHFASGDGADGDATSWPAGWMGSRSYAGEKVKDKGAMP